MPVVEDEFADYTSFLLSDIPSRLKEKMKESYSQEYLDSVPALTRSCIKEAYKEYQFRKRGIPDTSSDSTNLVSIGENNSLTSIMHSKISHDITQFSLPYESQSSLATSDPTILVSVYE
jgi:hypothetical protein